MVGDRLDAESGKCHSPAAPGGAEGELTIMTTAITRLITKLRGEGVGTDEFGNQYYQDRKVAPNGRRKRWVVYEGDDEASKVPPEWNAWLHYTIDDIPDGSRNQDWQKPHSPNLTGTPEAYRPVGHTLRGGKRASATGDYEAGKPE